MMAAGLTVGTAATASAASLCPGSLIDTYYNKTSEGTVVSKVQLYYSSANNGTDCAVNTAVLYAGKTTQLSVYIGVGSTYDGDMGNYTSYAGPVKVTGTNGRCVDVGGSAANTRDGGPGEIIWSVDPGSVHCG
ncbi:hypothetical protein OG432_01590 [Streptomyces sp. NBC_00442]